MKKNIKNVVIYLVWHYWLFLIAFLVFAITLYLMYHTYEHWLNTKTLVSGAGAYIIAKKVLRGGKKLQSLINGQ